MQCKSVAVVVVGDLGRSPRMQYQALALAGETDFEVDLIGLDGTPTIEAISDCPRIRVHRIKNASISPPFNQNYLFRIIFKFFMQLFGLFSLLMSIQRPSFVVCQTPPAIPLLAVAYLVCRLRGSKLVIDWHNYGYSWLAVNRPQAGSLVILHRWYEKFWIKFAYANFCVSEAMRRDLFDNWGAANAITLYDRPQSCFRRLESDEKINFLSRYEWGHFGPQDHMHCAPNQIHPIIIVSSTSWTLDEDFGILIDALKILDEKIHNWMIENSTNYPLINLVITGKGDTREYYEKKFAQANIKHIKLFTVFLKFQDYASLLGCADLGICLHFSASKLDLPMKIVDMFAARLPVLAYNYECLNELVKDGFNGFTFDSSEQIAQIIFCLFSTGGQNSQLEKMRENLEQFNSITWMDVWKDKAKSVFVNNYESKNKKQH